MGSNPIRPILHHLTKPLFYKGFVFFLIIASLQLFEIGDGLETGVFCYKNGYPLALISSSSRNFANDYPFLHNSLTFLQKDATGKFRLIVSGQQNFRKHLCEFGSSTWETAIRISVHV